LRFASRRSNGRGFIRTVGSVAAAALVAMGSAPAGHFQVARVIRAAVLQADDGVNLATRKGVVFADKAVFTASFGSGDNEVLLAAPDLVFP